MVMRLGSKAEGADFFRMVIERDDLWRDLESSHIVLQGPVRLEELLVQRLTERAKQRGLMVRWVRVSHLNGAAELVRTLERTPAKESLARCLTRVAGWLARIKKFTFKAFGFEINAEFELIPPTPPAVYLPSPSADPVLIFIEIGEFSAFLERLMARDPDGVAKLREWLHTSRTSSGRPHHMILYRDRSNHA